MNRINRVDNIVFPLFVQINQIIDYFISHFLVMPVIPNDRIDEINRFCKRIDDIKREMFFEVVLSNSSPTNR